MEEPTVSFIDQMLRESGMPAVIADEVGIIRGVNEQFETAWGWPRDRLIGEPLAILVPAEFRVAHHAAFSRFLLTGKGTILQQPLEVPFLDGAGGRVTAELCVFADHSSGQWMFAATAVPVGMIA